MAILFWNSASFRSGVPATLPELLLAAELRKLPTPPAGTPEVVSLTTVGALLLDREALGVVLPVAVPPALLIAALSSVAELELALAGTGSVLDRVDASGTGALLLERELRGVEAREVVATPAAVVVAPGLALLVLDTTGVEGLSQEAAALAAIAALFPLSMWTAPPAVASNCLLRYQLSMIRSIRATCSVTYRLVRSSCISDLATTSTILRKKKTGS